MKNRVFVGQGVNKYRWKLLKANDELQYKRYGAEVQECQMFFPWQWNTFLPMEHPATEDTKFSGEYFEFCLFNSETSILWTS